MSACVAYRIRMHRPPCTYWTDCNKKCQLDGWKNVNHKQSCKVYTDNRSTHTSGIAEPVPICLKSCRWLGEGDLGTTMDRRVELFFAELQRWAGQTNEKGREEEANVHLQASVQWTLGCARLQCAVTFYDFAKDGVAEVTSHPVDEGDAAKRNPPRIRYPVGGSQEESVE